MIQLILSILAVCTSLLAWIVLSGTVFSLFCQRRRRKEWMLGLIREHMTFALCYCVIGLLKLMTSFTVVEILFHISTIASSGYVFFQSRFYRFLKRKVIHYLFPNRIFNSVLSLETAQEIEDREEKNVKVAGGEIQEIYTTLPEEKARLIHEVLDSPAFLYNPDISLNLLMRKVGINSTYLSRYFNHQLGKSFPVYVMERRLDKAEELLRDTDMKVMDIFEQVGFQNSSTFYQAFNERHQLSPLQWRENVREGVISSR